MIADGRNGLLVAARRRGRASSGIPAYVPKVKPLAEAIESLTEPVRLAGLRDGVRAARAELDWDRTVADYAALLASFG